MKKIKIAVLSGGPSSEYDVSLASRKTILANLNKDRFKIIDISISKENIWTDNGVGNKLIEKEGIEYLKRKKIDLVLIAIHGEYGEDGTIQKIFEKAKINFIGSNSQSSALAMDKIKSSQLISKAGLATPYFIYFDKKKWEDCQGDKNNIFQNFSFPVVVKPNDKGSSIGINIILNKIELALAINEALKISDKVIVQEYIKGRELTCGVIEENGKNLIALAPTEIVPASKYDFFDYKAKYLVGGSKEITPPELAEKNIREIQQAAIIAHTTLGCTGISRTDFIFDDRNIFFLELNTLPGLTETSLLPQGAEAIGLEMPQLLEILIDNALAKNKVKD